MNVELAIAGLGCFGLAFGHAMPGLRWILPDLKGRLPGTPLGPLSMTLGMVRFTWRAVSLMVGFAVLSMTLAFFPHSDPKTLLLRWFAALWLAATAPVLWNARAVRAASCVFRCPLVFVVIAVTSWTESGGPKNRSSCRLGRR